MKTMAETADRHTLYQKSVQDAGGEIDFVLETWQKLHARPAVSLREDFCGTSLVACEWVRRDPAHTALGVDLDPEVLEWGRAHNLSSLDGDQRKRIRLLEADVLDVRHEPVDIVQAMNFSYYLFMERAQLLGYFRAARRALVEDGIFILDAYGGYDSHRVIRESRECEGFTYIWDQASFNPIDSRMDCYIHFEFPDGSKLDKAFCYRWRLWTLPEIRELLLEAGFARAVVYWEGTDPQTGKGNDVYLPSEVGDPDPGWVCYVVARASP